MWSHRPHGYGPPEMRQMPLSSPSFPAQARQSSAFYAHPSGYSKPQECDDDYAEEGFFGDACGDEHQPPREGESFCGIDMRPLLPLAMVVSTVASAASILGLQLVLLMLKIGVATVLFYPVFVILYMVTLYCMAYATWADPGQLRREHAQAFAQRQARSRIQAVPNVDDMPLPPRAQKTWQYKRPLRRYDHYCRWTCNCIALLNHREFVLMCLGLATLSVLSIILDAVVLVMYFGKWVWMVLVGIHVVYAIIVLALVMPIIKIHLGLISRNELAAEWKRNDFYVVSKAGKMVSVNELGDEEYNHLFDQFIYDPKQNPWDKGCQRNCWGFWCTPRWPVEQLGDF